MQATVGNEALNDLLKELAIGSVSELIRDSLMTEILCKISDFSDEVSHFEKKYGKSFPEFNTQYEGGEEEFEQYDDLMAWEFAQHGKQYWETKLEEAKSVL
jgi:septation ring formation regulator EzrA